MPKESVSVKDYLASLPEDRKKIISEIRDVISKNLPKGFEETINYGMIAYVVPHSIYPDGYHCDPKQPLPFVSLASQKNHIAIYHMAMYDDKLREWFESEWEKYSDKKLDIGKSCIKFKKPEDVPIKLIEGLAKKIKPKEWIDYYESVLNTNKKKK